jgi:hypothetical protein
MIPAGLGTKKCCAVEDQQQFTRADRLNSKVSRDAVPVWLNPITLVARNYTAGVRLPKEASSPPWLHANIGASHLDEC